MFRRSRRLGFVLLLVIRGVAMAQPAPATGDAQAVRFTVSFPAPQTHYVEITADVDTRREPQIELMMPVWAPGSYLVREFSRNVEGFTATADGRPLDVEKTDKNRWRVRTNGAPRVTVRYRVYSRELSQRTNWVDSEFALLNGAATFVTPVDQRARSYEVAIQLPADWKRVVTGLAKVPGAEWRFRAADFDTLVDSPMLIGNPSIYEFTVGGKKHYLANEGEDGIFDGARAARDLEAIVREHLRFWGSLPYDEYYFLNVLTDTPRGGLEHKNSTVLVMDRWSMRTTGGYVGWLETAAHELFHAWNVKRLRPVELGPFNYEEEVFTRSLWIAEGITDYYATVIVNRAGLSSRDTLLSVLSNQIENVQTSPGRYVRSVTDASFDAWIKEYRPDENSRNVSVGYYDKGFVLGFLLDAKIRRATGGARSLDDVMRAAYARYSGARGYTPDEFRAVAEQVAGVSFAPFWSSVVDGTGELEYAEALDWFGLRFAPASPPTVDGRQRAWLGVATRNDAGRLVVSEVTRGTPAYEAGVNVDDEIIGIDDFRVRADRFSARLERYKPGDRITLFIARREQLQRLPVTLGAEPARAWRLEVDPSANASQARQREGWLRGTS